MIVAVRRFRAGSLMLRFLRAHSLKFAAERLRAVLEEQAPLSDEAAPLQHGLDTDHRLAFHTPTRAVPNILEVKLEDQLASRERDSAEVGATILPVFLPGDAG